MQLICVSVVSFCASCCAVKYYKLSFKLTLVLAAERQLMRLQKSIYPNMNHELITHAFALDHYGSSVLTWINQIISSKRFPVSPND